MWTLLSYALPLPFAIHDRTLSLSRPLLAVDAEVTCGPEPEAHVVVVVAPFALAAAAAAGTDLK